MWDVGGGEGGGTRRILHPFLFMSLLLAVSLSGDQSTFRN